MSALPPVLDEHFRNPRSAGVLPGANARGRGGNPACGDLLVLELRIEGERVLAAGFQARACSAVIACASLLCARLCEPGTSVDVARSLDLEALVQAAGGLPRQRAHATRVCMRALSEALRAGGSDASAASL
jgi:NifU-like protein involved in Fe-S cluster formation